MSQQHFSLYAIYEFEPDEQCDHIDHRLLPFDITDGVRIENVTGRFGDSFQKVRDKIGSVAVNELEHVELALVHRYDVPVGGKGKTRSRSKDIKFLEESQLLTTALADCLRLIRPMPQCPRRMWGTVSDDGSLSVRGFDHPVPCFFIPECQMHFRLRKQDAEDLRRCAPAFFKAVEESPKFHRAVEMYSTGHLLDKHWEARYLLWCDVIDMIFGGNRNDVITKKGIRSFLGADTSIYAPGDIPSLLPQPHVTIADLIDDLFKLRHQIATGDRIPDLYFEAMRQGRYGDVSRLEVLTEALSLIVRSSLLNILRGGFVNTSPRGREVGRSTKSIDSCSSCVRMDSLQGHYRVLRPE